MEVELPVYDLTEWFVMPSIASHLSYGRETHHLEGVTLDGVTPAEKEFHINTGYSLKFVKSQQGFPIEVKPYDTEFIYDRTTENGWTSDRDFKQFNPMLAICPRWWDGISMGPTHQSSPFEFWENCAVVKKADAGQVKYELAGPFDVTFGGDVGVTACIILRYYWNGTSQVYLDREELFLTLKVGWCKWTHSKLVNGVYQIDTATLHNKIVAGGPPPVQFPCLQIP